MPSESDFEMKTRIGAVVQATSVTSENLLSSHESLDNLAKIIERIIGRRKLPNCLQDYELQLRNRPLISSKRLRRALRWFNVIMIQVLSGIHHVNLETSFDPAKLNFKQKCHRFYKELTHCRPTWKRCLSFVVLIQVYLIFRFTAILYHQYAYDFNKIRLGKVAVAQPDLRQLNNITPNAIVPLKDIHNNHAGSRQTDRFIMLEASINQSGQSLRAIGAPHMEWAIVIECIYTYMLQAGLFTLILVPIYVNFSRCVHSAWARYFLNPARERRAQARLIVRQVNEFVKSSRAYTRGQLETIMLTTGDLGSTIRSIRWRLKPTTPVDGRRISWRTYKEEEAEEETANRELSKMSQVVDTPATRLLLQKHHSRCLQVKSIALNGDLSPLVDRSDAWLDTLALLNISLLFSMLVYCFAWSVVLYVELKGHFDGLGHHVRHDSDQDQLTSWCTCLGLALLFVSASLLGQLGVLSFLDIIRPIETLRVLLLHTINQNDAAITQLIDTLEKMAPQERDLLMIQWRLAEAAIEHHREPSRTGQAFVPFTGAIDVSPLRPSRRGSNGSIVGLGLGRRRRTIGQMPWTARSSVLDMFKLMESIETSTTICLLQYKCFCVDFGRMKHSYELFAFISMYLAGTLPLIARLHIPYLGDFKARAFTVGISAAVVTPAFLSTWPCSFIHSRCLNIYRCLWSLLSQLARLEAKSITREYLNLDHQISLLRKELALPEEFSHKFACRLAGLVDLTYPNLLRIQFGISLVTISMLLNISLMGDSVMKGFLADPFGVFK